MIVENHGNNVYSMDSLKFTANDTPFLITGTRKLDSGRYEVDVKNLTNGKTKTFDHTRLCIIIKKSQREAEMRTDKPTPAFENRPAKHHQTGFNI